MNIKHLIAVTLTALAAGSTAADQVYPYSDFSGFQSTRTRAEVVAELGQAQGSTAYVAGGSEFVAPDAGFASSKTRAQVVAELRQALEDGSYQVVGGEAFPGQYPGVVPSPARTRLATTMKPASAY